MLPATTRLEQLDLHRPYVTPYTMWNEVAIAPLGEACSNAALFHRLAARMGVTEPCFTETDEAVARSAHDHAAPVNATLDFDVLKRCGWQRLALPERWAPFANGNLPTPSGRGEFESEAARQQGFGALRAFVPPRASALGDAALAARYPLVLLTPPSRHCLNASFSSMASLRRDTGEPTVKIHPADAAARGSADGMLTRAHNDRGAFTGAARGCDRVRTAGVVAPLIGRQKLSADCENASGVTSGAPTDIGRRRLPVAPTEPTPADGGCARSARHRW